MSALRRRTRRGVPRAAAILLYGVLLVVPPACGRGGSVAGAGPESAAPAPPAFALRAVVAPAIAALEAEVGAGGAPAALVGPGTEEGSTFPAVELPADAKPVDPEELRGLVTMLASSQGRMRALASRDVLSRGPAAIPALTAVAQDTGAAPDTRAAALEVLAGLDDARAEITLLELLRTLKEPGLRAHAAWRLAQGTRDCVLPALVLQLKYESDPDTLAWIATALARRGNLAGVVDLLRRVEEAPDDPRSEEGRNTAAALATERGFADARELRDAWRAGAHDERFPVPARSRAFDLALWRFVDRLREYQLRGVDDARFVIEHLDGPAAAIVADALHDDDVYVRTHVAQALGRMGPRARTALPALVEALADPRTGASAAEALGAIGDPAAEPALLPLSQAGVAPGLRLAAVRALGELGPRLDAAGAERLRALFEAHESGELWQAAGEGLLASDAGPDVALALAPCLTGGPPGEPLESATTERALGAWLERRALAGAEGAQALLDGWTALELEKGYFPPPPETVRAKLAQRRALLEARLPAPGS